MTDDNVVLFRGLTTLRLPADLVLDNTPRTLKAVTIIGYDENDEFYFSSSEPGGPEVLWQLEQAKLRLLNVEVEG